MKNIVMYSDGGARGNPGPAGVGVVIMQHDGSEDGEIVHEISEYIGEGTNNQAEYLALISGLDWIKKNLHNLGEIQCMLDSELVVRQLKGEYRVKNEDLKEKYNVVVDLVRGLGGKVGFVHVPREKNRRADLLVNKAIDKFQKEG